MVDIAVESWISLREAAKLVGVSYTTVHRWYKYGHEGIYLEGQPLPGRVRTSLEAVMRFSERIRQSDSPPEPPRRTSQSTCDQLRERHRV